MSMHREADESPFGKGAEIQAQLDLVERESACLNAILYERIGFLLNGELGVIGSTACARNHFTGLDLPQVAQQLGYTDLLDHARNCLHELTSIERVLQWRNGWYLSRLQALPATETSRHWLLLTLDDITQFKQGLDLEVSRLTEAYNRFYNLFQQSPVPTVFCRASNLRVVDANQRALLFIGRPREEVIGFTMPEFGIWPHEEAASELAGIQITSEETLQLISGEVRHVILSRIVTEYLGEPHILAYFVDITERKAAEEKVRDLATRLSRAEQEERHRISQVLHDDLQQVLFGLQMRLSSLPAEIAVDAHVEELQKLTDEAIAATRAVTISLSPPALAYERLSDLLSWLRMYMKDHFDLEVETKVDDSLTVNNPDIRLLVFQTARELLFNVVKHAMTNHARLALHRVGDEVVLTITDRGRGFDADHPDVERDSGFGLHNLRERMELSGGKLQIESSPGVGTRVEARIRLI